MTLADKIRQEAAYQGPSKAERMLWNKAIEAAIVVVEKNIPTTPQCLPQSAARPTRNFHSKEEE